MTSVNILWVYYLSNIRDSLLGVVTTLREGGPRFQFRQERKIYSSYRALSLTPVPTHTHYSLSLFSRVKWQESKVDGSPSSSAEVKNEWSYTSTLLEDSMTWEGIILPLRISGIGFTSLEHLKAADEVLYKNSDQVLYKNTQWKLKHEL